MSTPPPQAGSSRQGVPFVPFSLLFYFVYAAIFFVLAPVVDDHIPTGFADDDFIDDDAELELLMEQFVRNAGLPSDAAVDTPSMPLIDDDAANADPLSDDDRPTVVGEDYSVRYIQPIDAYVRPHNPLCRENLDIVDNLGTDPAEHLGRAMALVAPLLADLRPLFEARAGVPLGRRVRDEPDEITRLRTADIAALTAVQTQIADAEQRFRDAQTFIETSDIAATRRAAESNPAPSLRTAAEIAQSILSPQPRLLIRLPARSTAVCPTIPSTLVFRPTGPSVQRTASPPRTDLPHFSADAKGKGKASCSLTPSPSFPVASSSFVDQMRNPTSPIPLVSPAPPLNPAILPDLAVPPHSAILPDLDQALSPSPSVSSPPQPRIPASLKGKGKRKRSPTPSSSSSSSLPSPPPPPKHRQGPPSRPCDRCLPYLRATCQSLVSSNPMVGAGDATLNGKLRAMHMPGHYSRRHKNSISSPSASLSAHTPIESAIDVVPLPNISGDSTDPNVDTSSSIVADAVPTPSVIPRFPTTYPEGTVYHNFPSAILQSPHTGLADELREAFIIGAEEASIDPPSSALLASTDANELMVTRDALVVASNDLLDTAVRVLTEYARTRQRQEYYDAAIRSRAVAEDGLLIVHHPSLSEPEAAAMSGALLARDALICDEYPHFPPPDDVTDNSSAPGPSA
ncbi:hypothetical protein C8J56DRAFT_1042355 [Mycena floridula]|nr:hypothetical protein C8J56DRAFT_1042355 [Mycena floridula]